MPPSPWLNSQYTFLQLVILDVSITIATGRNVVSTTRIHRVSGALHQTLGTDNILIKMFHVFKIAFNCLI